MPIRLRRSLAIAVALVAAATIAAELRPTHRIAEQAPRVELEAMIPAQFADWRIEEGPIPLQPSPDVSAKLDRLYDQVLARTYINAANRRVMLSVAYGGNQLSDRMQAHRPEYCYAAQGYAIRAVGDESLATGAGVVPVRRLFAQRNARHEPITYWLTIGNRAILPGLDRKLAQLRFGLTGTIPDGMIVRVSSLDADTQAGYALQDQFIREMLESMRPDARTRLLGTSQQSAASPSRG